MSINNEPDSANTLKEESPRIIAMEEPAPRIEAASEARSTSFKRIDSGPQVTAANEVGWHIEGRGPKFPASIPHLELAFVYQSLTAFPAIFCHQTQTFSRCLPKAP